MRANRPEEEKYGPPVVHTVHIVIVIHVGLDGINEARVQLLSLVKDEERLRAPQHHVSYCLPKLTLI